MVKGGARGHVRVAVGGSSGTQFDHSIELSRVRCPHVESPEFRLSPGLFPLFQTAPLLFAGSYLQSVLHLEVPVSLISDSLTHTLCW